MLTYSRSQTQWFRVCDNVKLYMIWSYYTCISIMAARWQNSKGFILSAKLDLNDIIAIYGWKSKKLAVLSLCMRDGITLLPVIREKLKNQGHQSDHVCRSGQLMQWWLASCASEDVCTYLNTPWLVPVEHYLVCENWQMTKWKENGLKSPKSILTKLLLFWETSGRLPHAAGMHLRKISEENLSHLHTNTKWRCFFNIKGMFYFIVYAWHADQHRWSFIDLLIAHSIISWLNYI